MAGDKFSALWLSHTSISDFIKCPRSYYLKNVYRDPKTNRKMKIMSPSLALGQAVHDVIESLSILPTAQRFTYEDSFLKKYEQAWSKVAGKKGGFFDPDSEHRFKMRGQEMLNRVRRNPGPLVNLAVKLKGDLPYYWLSEKDNYILCGKLDWLEYLKDQDSVHIIDFKTGKRQEHKDSLQLPIYMLLVQNVQKRPVKKISYWYMEFNDAPEEKELADLETAKEQILDIALKIKVARQFNKFVCAHGGCMFCEPYEKVLKGDAEFVETSEYGQDIFILNDANEVDEDDSIIL
jgi:ATP-dependent helicase/DNAse subunit B